MGLIASIVLYGEIFSSFAECFWGNQTEFLQTLPVLPLMVKATPVKLSLPGTSGHFFSLPSPKFRVYSAKRELSTKDLSNVKYTTKYKTEFVLSSEQKEALIGIILGDGFLERNKPNHNTRLRIEQSYPEKEGYLMSLSKLLEPLTAMTPVILTRKDRRSDSVTKSLYLYSFL